MTLWGGRFSSQMDPAAWALNASLPVDRRLALQDVRGSQAWAAALLQAGILNPEEHAQVAAGLAAILAEFSGGTFAFAPSDEDIHTAVERRLGELIGPLAGKLHTGRSRNDQVATDFRLWLLETLPAVDLALKDLQAALLEQAEQSGVAIMPGYTHLQRAQPVLLAHWWLSHALPLQRDRQRLADLTSRLSVLPLGSGALSGTTLHVDRQALAASLGFAAVSQNSIDAVADRDFALEFLFCAALAGVHLSRLSEQIVLFTTAEFGYFDLSDAFATGSSLMPQKKNPDLFELARGKSGALIGLLAGLLATLKGLPSAYDKDLQEDKAPVFQAADTLLAVLPALAGAVRTITPRLERMRAAVDPGMLATELADALVAGGLPFREAHAAVGKAVRLAAERGVPLSDLSYQDFQSLGSFDADLFAADQWRAAFDPLKAVERRAVAGGTAPSAVLAQIQQLKGEINP